MSIFCFLWNSMLLSASFVTLFVPNDTCSLESHTITKDFVILQLLDFVKSRYVFWKYDTATAKWLFVGQEEGCFTSVLFNIHMFML